MRRRAALLLLMAAAPAACGPGQQAPVPPRGEQAALADAEAMLTDRLEAPQEEGPARN